MSDSTRDGSGSDEKGDSITEVHGVDASTPNLAPMVPGHGGHHAEASGHAAQQHSPHARAEHLRFGHIDFAELRPHEHEPDGHALTYLIRRPHAHQYFHRGRLFRSVEGRGAGRIELFFDLVYVGLIAVLAQPAVADPGPQTMAAYLATYLPAFMVWNNVREMFNVFYNDDILQRTLVFWIMALLVVYGNNAPHVADDVGARRAALGAYIVCQGSILLTMLLYSVYVRQYRVQLRAQAAFFLIPLALYITAIFMSQRAALALVLAGVGTEYAAWNAIYHPVFKRLFALEYGSALNIEHEVDRHADFFTLVMGEFLYAALLRSPAGVGIHQRAGRAVLALLIAACLQLFYVLAGSCGARDHPLRRSANTAFAWFAAHIPAVAALTLVGDACAELIEEEDGVAQGVRWIFCGGLCTGLMCLAAMAFLEKDRDEPGTRYLSKELRITPRVITALVVVFLPLVPQEHLGSTNLLGIAAALCYATLFWETVTALKRLPATARGAGRGLGFATHFRAFPPVFDPQLQESGGHARAKYHCPDDGVPVESAVEGDLGTLEKGGGGGAAGAGEKEKGEHKVGLGGCG